MLLESFPAVIRVFGPIFMSCALRLVLGGTMVVGSHFHVLRNRTHFRRYGGCQVPFSCLALPDLFSAVSRVSGPFFMFCALDSFSAITRASGPIFVICAHGHVFGGSEGVRSRFHILRARNYFRRYQGRQLVFSCFALPDSFSTLPRASCPVHIFCAPRLIFGGTEGDRSRFHVLRARNLFRLSQRRRVSFSCFAVPGTFSSKPRSSAPVFMFCVPRLVFIGSEGARSRFHLLRSCTHFRRNRGRRFSFSSFTRPDSFSAVLMASRLVFIFCALGLVFGGTEGVGSRFHVLHARTRF
jgi:hypothetical protein